MFQIFTKDEVVHQLVGYKRETSLKILNMVSSINALFNNPWDFYDILNQHDESKAVDMIYLDFQHSFDNVPI